MLYLEIIRRLAREVTSIVTALKSKSGPTTYKTSTPLLDDLYCIFFYYQYGEICIYGLYILEVPVLWPDLSIYDISVF